MKRAPRRSIVVAKPSHKDNLVCPRTARYRIRVPLERAGQVTVTQRPLPVQPNTVLRESGVPTSRQLSNWLEES